MRSTTRHTWCRKFGQGLLAASAATALIISLTTSAMATTVPAPRPGFAHTASQAAATQPALVVSQPRAPKVVNGETWQQAWQCGLSAGLGRLLKLGPKGQDLYYAIKATLTGKKLAANISDLIKVAVLFFINVLPYGSCFEPYFFPPKAGGGATPAAPTSLTVKADPGNGTILKLAWSENSNNVLYFDINNGVDTRTTTANNHTYTWTGLKPGSWNCFRVRATNGDSASHWDPNVSPYYVCAFTSSGQQCVFLNQATCTSSNPEITVEVENTGDTSGCVFSWHITWGDGTQTTVQISGSSTTGPIFLANNTYQHTGTFSISADGTVLSGTCTVTNASFTFTYS